MPHIIVKLWVGKTEAQKKKLTEELTKTAMSVIGYSAGSFSVAIEDFEPKDWKEKVFIPDILNQQDKLYKKPEYSINDL